MHNAPTLSLAKKLWFKTLLSNLSASGYSKTEIAQRIGISPQRLTNLINGSDSLTDKVIDSFSSAFQLGNIRIESENSVSTGSVSDSLKEKNMVDFEQKYNKLVEAARTVVEANPGLCKIDEGLGRLSKLLPEKQSEDERIRKRLVEYFNGYYDRFSSRNNVNVHWEGLEVKAVIAYLKRIKEQKPVKLNNDTEVGLDRALQIVKAAKGNLRGCQSDDGIYECDHAIQTLERILKNGIEQKSTELPKSEDYGIDGLYRAVDILQKTLGKVDGYQTDDGILEHKCAISAVKELYEQQPAEWNEEDEIMLRKCISATFDHGYLKESDWLKSRLHLQPKIEWTIEDAKPGDILTTDTVTFIFKSVDKNGFVSMYCSYSVLTTDTNLIFSDTSTVDSQYVHPASIEQRREFLEELLRYMSNPTKSR